MAYASDGGAAAGRPERGFWPESASAGARGSASRSENASLAARRGLPACPELDCVRGRLAPGLVAYAERRAEMLGVGADQVLIAAGAITDDAYAVAFARSLGIDFEPLDELHQHFSLEGGAGLVGAATRGHLMLGSGPTRRLVVAPQGLMARRLIQQVAAHPNLAHEISITSSTRLRRFVQRTCAAPVGRYAIGDLRHRRPLLSAAPARRTRLLQPWMLWLASYTALLIAAPAIVIAATQILLTLGFLAWAGLRVAGALSQPQASARFAGAERDLPIYTIIVALHREARSAGPLVAALGALDYPPEKLDVKFVVEPDDRATRNALEAARGSLPFEVLVAPPLAPRTKPKALNVALPYARGAYTVVYDAEDRPEPDQLRRALAAFMQGPRDLACVQARLTIDNTRDGWLAALFTAEYAGLFDVLLPGLARRGLPIPLGGSSNHFKTAILRDAGAWDPFNVTEDADLGTRLARLGYRSGVIASSTYEEAPTRLAPWLRQRTRWFKGWLQTWAVHMREPVLLLRELGLAGFVTFQLMLMGTVFAALLQPFALTLLLAMVLLDWSPFPHAVALDFPGLAWVHVSVMSLGYLVSMMVSGLGLKRRGLLTPARFALLPLWMMGHWGLLSVAAWRAAYQYVFDRYGWEKTQHGLARTSRRAETLRRPLRAANTA